MAATLVLACGLPTCIQFFRLCTTVHKRRNWLFFGSNIRWRTAAVLNSLIATCKQPRIDPFAYLRDDFARISDHPNSRLEQPLLDRWVAPRAAPGPLTQFLPSFVTSSPPVPSLGSSDSY